MNNRPVILFCFLYWHGDQKQVESVARLACDLRKECAEDAELMFVARYDSPPPTKEIQYQASVKFSKVHVWKCDRKGLGFPGGCNEMAYGLLNYILIQRHMNNGFKNIDALMIVEGDVAFTRPTYVEELQDAWKAAQESEKLVVGALQNEQNLPGYKINEHINAVALYHPEILRTIPTLVGGPNQHGWDHWHGPSIVPRAINSPLFRLDYRRETITPEELFTEPFPLVYHGVKDDGALKAVREKYDLK